MLAQPSVAEVALHGPGQRLGVSRLDQQPILSVLDHLADTAGCRSQHRGPYGERLDHRVREVLPR